MANSLRQATVNFTGANRILQGANWKRTIELSADLAAYFDPEKPNDGARATFVDRFGRTQLETAQGGKQNLQLRLLDGTHLEFSTRPQDTRDLPSPMTGTFHVEVVSPDGSVERPIGGAWALDRELVKAED